jgi:hypothetical protein
LMPAEERGAAAVVPVRETQAPPPQVPVVAAETASVVVEKTKVVRKVTNAPKRKEA